jgi:exodeoxyribonuclease-3
MRIDHLLLNRELAPRLKDADVDRWVRGQPKASDHAPVWIELSDKPGRKSKPKKKNAANKVAKKPAAKVAKRKKVARKRG